MTVQTLTIEEVEKAICDAIATATGIAADHVLIEPYGGPQPSDLHATYRTLAPEGTDYPEIDFSEIQNGFQETITDTTYIRSQIKIVGAGAVSKLKGFCLALRSANRFVDLYKKVGLGGVEEVQNISTEVINSRIQEQAVVHINWYAAITAQSNIDYFQQAKVNVEVPEHDVDLQLTIPKEILT